MCTYSFVQPEMPYMVVRFVHLTNARASTHLGVCMSKVPLALCQSKACARRKVRFHLCLYYY